MDPSLVGRTGKPFEMRVETGKVREFARATKSTNPAYFAEDPVSLATFLMSASFWSGPDNSAWGEGALDFKRLLHGGQEFVFHGPPPKAGTRLTALARVDAVYEKEGRRGGSMQFGEVVTEFRDADSGELVAELRSIAIETSRSTTEGGGQ